MAKKTRRAGKTGENPFHVGGLVAGRHFTDRTAEIRRIAGALTEGQGRLLVVGPRRVGKSSAIVKAIGRVERAGGVAMRVDLETASTQVDLATRVLQSASQALGRRWKEVPADLVHRLSLEVGLTPDPSGGAPLPSFSPRFRSAPAEIQRDALAQVLGAIDATARTKKKTVAVALDEFQVIAQLGGEAAALEFARMIERHRHLAYVVAGSRENVIERLTAKGAALHNKFEPLRFEPIDPLQLGRWIESRMEKNGVRAATMGSEIVRVAGPRTRDVVQLARATYELGVRRQEVRLKDVAEAFRRVVLEESEQFRAVWDRLPPSQQNVLRSMAAGERKLYGRESRTRFGLQSTAEIAQALEQLMKLEFVVKQEDEYLFDNPFMRGWVAEHALRDVGMF